MSLFTDVEFIEVLDETDAARPEDTVTVSDETVRWRAREASYLAGNWGALSKRIPRFTIEEFKAVSDGPANPHIRSVVRQPLMVAEKPIPVGVVSNTYHLAQHAEVVEMCFNGLRAHGIDPQTLRCELGLTPLGEWMNFRAFFPEAYAHTPADGNGLALRLECFNSVDGSSRLAILLGWFRFICSNGLIVGETKAALRDVHDEHLNLGVIPDIVTKGLSKVKADLERLALWGQSEITLATVECWVDTKLAKQWGKKAACRTLHICRTGADVELTDPFAGGNASDKPTRNLADVPGAAKPARNLYDVCQALSWIATHRSNAEERLEWQGHIPELIDSLRTHSEAA
jgi:hypothetical protein